MRARLPAALVLLAALGCASTPAPAPTPEIRYYAIADT
jgi:hypothetical protein